MLYFNIHSFENLLAHLKNIMYLCIQIKFEENGSKNHAYQELQK